ncbi:DUF934 domain-containing protein [Oceanibacterium hippocampi]|uniref:Oxidoreductase n=1 Tax=Oceanibacterium hippocampi TaxID=745714 RepID=A0A1Y5R7R2_9PROT|nr:DUF934 domain-containing protein [Oceanibacterium hippocampi]SLN10469.1 hypothetical protein OCH7691_00038 [Oceanibacterium hippocampi]
MDKILKDGVLIDNEWTDVTGYEALSSLPSGDIVVPLDQWLEHRADLVKRNSRLGVRLRNDEDPARLADDLGRIALVVLEFPSFGDGRALSQANLLRRRLGFEGEIRATGDVQRDQMNDMRRCGVDAFAVRPDRDALAAAEAFDDFTYSYQPTADGRLPISRIRRGDA